MLLGTDDGEIVAEASVSDLEITIEQFGGQSSQVTDRDYTVTMETTGGEGTFLLSNMHYICFVYVRG